jgi:hypothetical protein
VAAFGLFPAIASAVVTVKVGSVSVNQSPTDQTVNVDVWAQVDPADTTNELMDAFTIALDAPTFSATGPRFVLPASGTFLTPDPEHPYVFTGKDAPPGDFASDQKRIQVGAAISSTGVDITPNLNGLVRLQVMVPGNTAPGAYSIVLDPGAFSLGGGPALVAVPDPTGGGVNVIGVPEPASLGLIGLGGILFLRRRRVA